MDNNRGNKQMIKCQIENLRGHQQDKKWRSNGQNGVQYDLSTSSLKRNMQSLHTHQDEADAWI
jgi:hypothetical protein